MKETLMKFVLQERGQHHWPSGPSAIPDTWLDVLYSRIFSALNPSDNHLVSVLADEGKCKVWSHEENQVAHKGDHLGLIWFGFTREERMEKVNASSLCLQNVNQAAHKRDHLGLGFSCLQACLFRTVRITLRRLMITSY